MAEIIIEKQRNGPVGSVLLSFEERLARFQEYDRIMQGPRKKFKDVPF